MSILVFAIVLIGRRNLVDFLSLSSWSLEVAVWLFLAVPWVCLQFVIVVFPGIITIFSYYFQCVNTDYAKFEYKGMKTFGATDINKLGTPKVLQTER